MNTFRKTASMVGVLYIIGTAAGVTSVILSQPVRAAGDFLAGAAAHADQMIVAALCILLMGLSLAMVPVLLYPVLRRHSEVLALGYVVFRGGLETVSSVVRVIAYLLLVALGQMSVQAGSAATSGFGVPGALLLKAGSISFPGIIFCMGVLMFYGVLYRSRLVPRWITVWGLAAVVPYLAAELLAMFGLVDPMSSTGTLLYLPMALQEMVLAVWLIVKGFNAPAVAAEAARATRNELLSAA